MAQDDAVVHAVPDYVVPEETLPGPRPRPAAVEADIRLLRVQISEQSQLLATMHQVMVTGQQVVGEQLQRFREELEAQTTKIDRMAEMVALIYQHYEAP